MIWYDIACISAVTEAEYKLEFEPTKHTPYLALMGELWGVFCEDFQENLPLYNGAALYVYLALNVSILIAKPLPH